MTWFATGAMVVSAAVTAAGAISEGEASRSAHNTQADLARQNARIALRQGAEREAAKRRQAAMHTGKLQAAIGQSGIDITQGSAAGLVAQSATNAELDALNIRYDASMARLGYDRTTATERATAANAQSSGYFKAVAGIASSVASYSASGGTFGGTKPTTFDPKFDYGQGGYQ